MRKEKQVYRLSIPEFFLFDDLSKSSLLSIHGKVIYFNFIGNRLFVIVFLIYDFHIQVVKLIVQNKILEISNFKNSENYSKYINLKEIHLNFILS
jgi:hypothetical protein